jgi:hypothetical protein
VAKIIPATTSTRAGVTVTSSSADR